MILDVLPRVRGSGSRGATAGAELVGVGVRSITPEEHDGLAMRPSRAPQRLVGPEVGLEFLFLRVALREQELEPWNQADVSTGLPGELFQPRRGVAQRGVSLLVGDDELELGVGLSEAEDPAADIETAADVRECVDVGGLQDVEPDRLAVPGSAGGKSLERVLQPTDGRGVLAKRMAGDDEPAQFVPSRAAFNGRERAQFRWAGIDLWSGRHGGVRPHVDFCDDLGRGAGGRTSVGGGRTSPEGGGETITGGRAGRDRGFAIEWEDAAATRMIAFGVRLRALR